MERLDRRLALVLLVAIVVSWSLPCCSSSPTRRFHFNMEWKKVSRLCTTRQILTVNGEYPGPTIAVNEGDNVEIKVTNSVHRNTTIHWHGVKQIRSGWADGPAYITQCPIQGGRTYTYKFSVTEQRGTLLWHAHYGWQRASVYGAFIIYPKLPYPFLVPHKPIHAEIPIIFGEWWDHDEDELEKTMLATGAGAFISLAYTINGLPGPLYPCSKPDTFTATVEYGKTYMLRVINAALADELFFSVSKHTLTVVEVDAVYTKPFTTNAIMVAPGQTTTVLLTADQLPGPTGAFAMAATPYVTSYFPFDNSTTVGFLKYNTTDLLKLSGQLSPENLPKMEDTDFATLFASKTKSLNTVEYPCNVPQQIDRRVVMTISLNLQDCPQGKTCTGYQGKMFLASINNQSFVRPTTSFLETHYLAGLKNELGFPEQPPNLFNYTGGDPLAMNTNTEFGSKIIVVPYGTRIEMVLQGTNLLNVENHPIHVHGHNFFVVGTGFGNFDESKDPEKYNLVDPPERNTVAVPTGGWAAIRINADNPGVWFIHCHLEPHNSWGLATGFVVEDGPLPSQRLLPPPKDFPAC
ncbi:LAC1 [Linum grandiflorum]